MPDESTVDMLEMTPLSSGLNKGQLKAIVKSSKERFFKKGEAIVREGESASGSTLSLAVLPRSAATEGLLRS